MTFQEIIARFNLKGKPVLVMIQINGMIVASTCEHKDLDYTAWTCVDAARGLYNMLFPEEKI